MAFRLKTALKLASALVATAILAGAVEVALLVDPSTPSTSPYLRFEGYIPLPREKLLNVMDYVTWDADTLYVAGESSGSLFKIDLDPNNPAHPRAVSTLPGDPSVHGIALVPDRQRGYISRSEQNSVDVVDLASWRVIKRIPVAEDADAILYDPISRQVYLANGEPALATVIDADRDVVAYTLSLHGMPEFAVTDASADLVYQNLKDRNALAVIDPVKRAVIRTWDLPGCVTPTGLAMDSANRRLFINCAGNGRLLVFDIDRHQTVTALPISPHADTVSFDPVYHRIYSIGKGGTLSIIQQDRPDQYHLLDQVETHYGAHTLALDPVSHRLYVAYASLLVAPRIAVFSPERLVPGSAYRGTGK